MRSYITGDLLTSNCTMTDNNDCCDRVTSLPAFRCHRVHLAHVRSLQWSLRCVATEILYMKQCLWRFVHYAQIMNSECSMHS